MEPIYTESFTITHTAVDRYNRLKLSWLLALCQEVAGSHFAILNADKESLEEKGLFWAVIRTRVEIARLPGPGETVSVRTWPMPTTRVAYPRAAEALDQEGNVLFRSLSLWVLMDVNTRAMVLPGKSGVSVEGRVQGDEIAPPPSLVPKDLAGKTQRQVRYTELDVNGHMNNTRYLDWAEDLLTSDFHRAHPAREFTVCYLSEAKEGDSLELRHALTEDTLRIDAYRDNPTGTPDRVFSVQLVYA